jgi:hypothetical protein
LPCRYAYGYASNFEQPSIALAKVDVDTATVTKWEPGYQVFCLEPEFIPR